MNIEPDRFFHALADATRLRCLVLLQQQGELCVCELTHALGAAQPKISRHLASLRESGIVRDRRRGLWIYYRLNPELPHWAWDVLHATASAVSQQTPFTEDRQALEAMPNRPGAPCCA